MQFAALEQLSAAWRSHAFFAVQLLFIPAGAPLLVLLPPSKLMQQTSLAALHDAVPHDTVPIAVPGVLPDGPAEPDADPEPVPLLVGPSPGPGAGSVPLVVVCWPSGFGATAPPHANTPIEVARTKMVDFMEPRGNALPRRVGEHTLSSARPRRGVSNASQVVKIGPNRFLGTIAAMSDLQIYWVTGVAAVLVIGAGAMFAMEHVARTEDRTAMTSLQGAVDLGCGLLFDDLEKASKTVGGDGDLRMSSALRADGRVAEKMNIVWSREYTVCGFPRLWLDVQTKTKDIVAFNQLADAAMSQQGPELAATLQAMADRVAVVRARPLAR